MSISSHQSLSGASGSCGAVAWPPKLCRFPRKASAFANSSRAFVHQQAMEGQWNGDECSGRTRSGQKHATKWRRSRSHRRAVKTERRDEHRTVSRTQFDREQSGSQSHTHRQPATRSLLQLNIPKVSRARSVPRVVHKHTHAGLSSVCFGDSSLSVVSRSNTRFAMNTFNLPLAWRL